MKTKSGRHALVSREYHLWKISGSGEGGRKIILDFVINIGAHGRVLISPPVGVVTPGDNESEDAGTLCAVHNREELRRAVKERDFWAERVRQAPLGKTQQDYLAYFDDVVGRFTDLFV